MMQPQFRIIYSETTQQTSGLLDTYLEEHSDDPELIAESLAIDIMEDASRLLQRTGTSRSELAELMNVSRARVTRLFNSPPNMTLMSIARLSAALNAKPYIGLTVRPSIGLGRYIASTDLAGVGFTADGLAGIIGDGTWAFTSAADNRVITQDEGVLANVGKPQSEPVATGFAAASTH